MTSFVKKRKSDHIATDANKVSKGDMSEQIQVMLSDDDTTIVTEQQTLQESYTVFNRKSGVKLTLTVPKGGIVQPLVLKTQNDVRNGRR